MPNLSDRKCVVRVGDRRIEGLRIAFSVEKKAARESSKATLTINGLSKQTQALFDAADLPVIIEAGYLEQFGAVFVGKAYRTTHNRTPPDVSTTLECADGGAEVRTAKGAWTYGKGAQTARIIRDVVAGLGLPLSSGSRITPNPATVPNGWAFAGLAANALDAITKATDLSWSIQDGQVQILDGAISGDGEEAVVLSQTTGMIGAPQEGEVDSVTKQRRFTVRCLIQPRIRPERLVKIESTKAPKLSGLYRVVGLKVAGDNMGSGPDSWTMTLNLRLA